MRRFAVKTQTNLSMRRFQNQNQKRLYFQKLTTIVRRFNKKGKQTTIFLAKKQVHQNKNLTVKWKKKRLEKTGSKELTIKWKNQKISYFQNHDRWEGSRKNQNTKLSKRKARGFRPKRKARGFRPKKGSGFLTPKKKKKKRLGVFDCEEQTSSTLIKTKLEQHKPNNKIKQTWSKLAHSKIRKTLMR